MVEGWCFGCADEEGESCGNHGEGGEFVGDESGGGA